MSTDERLYVVDRIEGELVVLIDDDTGEKLNMSSWELPSVDEGMVLRVSLRNAEPQWDTVVIDHNEAEKRRGESARILEDLRKRDPGGDVAV